MKSDRVRRRRLCIEGGPSGRSLLVSGELDRSNAPVLLHAIRLAASRLPDGRALSVDCSGLAFLDASGAEALLAAAKMLQPDHRLVVVEPGAAVARLLRALSPVRGPTVVRTEDAAVLRRAS